MALLAGGMVGEIAHRIDRLARRAAGDEGTLAGEALIGREEPCDRGEDLGRLGHAAKPDLAAGQLAGAGADAQDAARGEGREVGLGCRVGPHLRVHRRGDQHRFVRGEKRRRGEVVGHARRHPGDQVGGRRRNDDQVGFAREADVTHLALVGQ